MINTDLRLEGKSHCTLGGICTHHFCNTDLKEHEIWMELKAK